MREVLSEIPEFIQPGHRIWARGWHGGSHKWFVGRVVKLRHNYPHIHVEYEKDEEGNTNKLGATTPTSRDHAQACCEPCVRVDNRQATTRDPLYGGSCLSCH